MSLIKCPECNKKISNTTTRCVYCGFEFNTIDSTEINVLAKNNNLKKKLVMLCTITTLLLIIIGFVFWLFTSNIIYAKRLNLSEADFRIYNDTINLIINDSKHSKFDSCTISFCNIDDTPTPEMFVTFSNSYEWYSVENNEFKIYESEVYPIYDFNYKNDSALLRKKTNIGYIQNLINEAKQHEFQDKIYCGFDNGLYHAYYIDSDSNVLEQFVVEPITYNCEIEMCNFELNRKNSLEGSPFPTNDFANFWDEYEQCYLVGHCFLPGKARDLVGYKYNEYNYFTRDNYYDFKDEYLGKFQETNLCVLTTTITDLKNFSELSLKDFEYVTVG